MGALMGLGAPAREAKARATPSFVRSQAQAVLSAPSTSARPRSRGEDATESRPYDDVGTDPPRNPAA
jgi:hypothetical protein